MTSLVGGAWLGFEPLLLVLLVLAAVLLASVVVLRLARRTIPFGVLSDGL